MMKDDDMILGDDEDPKPKPKKAKVEEAPVEEEREVLDGDKALKKAGYA